ncbi:MULTISPECIES: 16S rRNA (cytosine(967)-C(5))-methyltransferase RsmB [Anaerostipes]|uniref:16S rRNA (cytosine(967)-C(5))-methyltransferase RsmB n=1 Tax=Anaerostipes TaxID=207244 RepID=UPI0009534189|nr:MULTISPECIES: 16S rRNA (cytosine(967)-C(5))-methyltransferase RsmB [unclassified Anaerostipes]MCI5622372.1 16S rRNA (cytosine(967)-C(5))-methyltransferase RsmB [Anaerostipes sp.]MDY2727258.1 16S rRNA (cytosine(967)-C(5))-methyltransferase RsmB [Anaerostipes faecalis]OLR59161.1 16S rRNA (cytosine(967)-C(5))-methyltransferase [Anaerostipes sp. 494a]
MDNPRECALDVLIKVDKKEELSHIAIGNVLEKYQFSPKRDRAFFTRLTEGTLERQLTIDYVINQFSKTPVRKCKPLIRALLRMGTYQILYMDQIPDSAACNESVKLAKKRGFARLSGFVNGVLRNISRKQKEIKWPSREKDPVLFLSVIYSMPQWIIEFFLETYDFETVEKIAASYLEERSTSLCCLISRGTKDALKKELAEEGVTVEDGIIVKNAIRISDYDFLYCLDAFRDGKCIVQDESSMLAASLAEVEKGQLVLDVCSAPGGKALYTADQMEGTGKVIARDLTEYKTDLIEENIERTELSNICAEVFDARNLDEEMIGKADVVIADLPCSGLGIMAKKNDIKYNISKDSLDSLVNLQREILTNAVKYVKPGGTLIYSTCTINPAENEENFHWIREISGFTPVDFMENLPDVIKMETARKGYIQLLPGVHPCDGFFIGKLRRQ